MTWTAHPLRARPADAALAIAVMCAFCGAVLLSLQSGLLAAVALVVLLVSTAAYWLPTHYTVTEEYVEECRLGRRRRRQWANLRRVEVGPRIALVSPFSSPSWLDRYRGMVLYLDGVDRERVKRLLEERLAQADR